MSSERRLCGVWPKNGASAYQGGTGGRGMVVERRGACKMCSEGRPGYKVKEREDSHSLTQSSVLRAHACVPSSVSSPQPPWHGMHW